MIKFFVEPEAVSGPCIYLEKREDIKHLTKVLRAKCGDKIRCFGVKTQPNAICR